MSGWGECRIREGRCIFPAPLVPQEGGKEAEFVSSVSAKRSLDFRAFANHPAPDLLRFSERARPIGL
jgi:hypothetical protein